MGKLPLQTPKEVQANLKSLGFVFKNQVGSHKQYERPADATRQRAVVTVDVGKSQFSKDLMKNMIRQSRFSQDEFCSGVAKTPILTQKTVVQVVPEPRPAEEGKR
jgi:predicted RNA binding protein YcfA (HicA-like mRNA interferase family)